MAFTFQSVGVMLFVLIGFLPSGSGAIANLSVHNETSIILATRDNESLESENNSIGSLPFYLVDWRCSPIKITISNTNKHGISVIATRTNILQRLSTEVFVNNTDRVAEDFRRLIESEKPWDVFPRPLRLQGSGFVFSGHYGSKSWSYHVDYPCDNAAEFMYRCKQLLNSNGAAVFPTQSIMFTVASPSPGDMWNDQRCFPFSVEFGVSNNVVYIERPYKNWQKHWLKEVEMRRFCISDTAEVRNEIIQILTKARPWEWKSIEDYYKVIHDKNILISRADFNGWKWNWAGTYPNEEAVILMARLKAVMERFCKRHKIAPYE